MTDDDTSAGWVGLPRTIPAECGGIPVTLLDAAPSRLLVEHLRPLVTGPTTVQFMWQGERVQLHAQLDKLVEEVWDMTARGNLYASEFRIIEESRQWKRLIAGIQDRIETARAANLTGISEVNEIDENASIADLGAARRERLLGYVVWHLRDGKWTSEPSATPEQPAEGFTVASHEPEEQVALLRLAYQETDADGRRMMREFAALALRSWY